jgi:imidazolonepropionase-like amidohydrolase
MTDHPVVPIQYLALSAGLTIRGGLDEYRALQAITLDAAKILGLDHRIGSIEPGKEADLAIIDGHPFDTRSKVSKVFVSGQIAFDSDISDM